MLKQSNVFKQSSIPAREPRELHTITFYKKKGNKIKKKKQWKRGWRAIIK